MQKRLLTKFVLPLFLILGLFQSQVMGQITIDGDFTDWATNGTVVGTNGGVTMKVFDSGDYIFIYISGTDLSSTNNIFINSDGDASTGFNDGGWVASAQGAEILVQGAFTYSSTNTTGNGGWGWNSVQSNIPFSHTPTEMELSFYIYDFPITQNITIGANITEAGAVVSVPSNQTGTGWTPYTMQQVLPVELSSFEGRANKGSSNELTWATSLEIDNDYFSIEKSKDGRDFENVDKVAGAGNSDYEQVYNWTDAAPYDMTYYRLKQTDFSGSFSYSSVISIANEGVKYTDISISPNPAVNEVVVFTSELEQGAIVRVYDQIGRDVTGEVTLKSISDTSVQFNCSNLNSGMYFINVGGTTRSLQVIK